MSLTKKITWSGITVAVTAAMAFALLLAGPTGIASAAVNGVSTSRTTLDAAANSGSTECFTPAFGSGAGVAGTNCAILTIDANTADTPQLVTTVGTLAITPATGFTGGAGTLTGNGTSNLQVLTGNADTITAIFAAPSTGPATATITVITGTTSRSLTITIRGTADKVEVSALKDQATAGTSCGATDVFVVQATTATEGEDTAWFCVLVKDSAGTRLQSQPIVFTTTAGTLNQAADQTTATGSSAVAVNLQHGTTGTPGTKATVTVSSGGKSTTIDVLFGGDAKTCTITANPATVQTGGSSVITVDVKDGASTPGPIPDGVVVNVAQTNPGAGANAAILNGAPTTVNGKAQDTLIAAIPGAIALGASAGPADATISCTASVQATGTVVNPGGGGTPGAGGFTGTAPARGSIGLLVTSGASNAAGLVAALGTAGCPVESLAILEGGVWKIYINGAPAVVNAAFPASVPGTTAFFVRCA